MMPLTFAAVGEENMIKKVGGKAETKKFLENLGFVAGATVTVPAQKQIPPGYAPNGILFYASP